VPRASSTFPGQASSGLLALLLHIPAPIQYQCTDCQSPAPLIFIIYPPHAPCAAAATKARQPAPQRCGASTGACSSSAPLLPSQPTPAPPQQPPQLDAPSAGLPPAAAKELYHKIDINMVLEIFFDRAARRGNHSKQRKTIVMKISCYTQ